VWTVVTLFLIGLIVGIAYGMAGFADYPTMELVSGLAPLAMLGGWAGQDGGAGGDAPLSPSSPRPSGPTTCILPGSAIPGVMTNPASKLKDGLVSEAFVIGFRWPRNPAAPSLKKKNHAKNPRQNPKTNLTTTPNHAPTTPLPTP
jgi:hypothetical protein